jgi:hypothetical protein
VINAALRMWAPGSAFPSTTTTDWYVPFLPPVAWPDGRGQTTGAAALQHPYSIARGRWARTLALFMVGGLADMVLDGSGLVASLITPALAAFFMQQTGVSVVRFDSL